MNANQDAEPSLLDCDPRPTLLEARNSAEFFAVASRAKVGELIIYSIAVVGVGGWKFNVAYPDDRYQPNN